jgi:Flp pilus assembly pilin Flp
MHQMRIHVRRLLANEDGPTTCEYAILLALLIVAAIAGIRLLGPNMRILYTAVTAALG